MIVLIIIFATFDCAAAVAGVIDVRIVPRGVPGALFIVSGALLFATVVFLLLRGNRVLLSMGRGQGRYFAQGFRWLPPVVTVITVTVAALAGLVIVYGYAIGAADLPYSARHALIGAIGLSGSGRAKSGLLQTFASVSLPASEAVLLLCTAAALMFGDAKVVDSLGEPHRRNPDIEASRRASPSPTTDD